MNDDDKKDDMSREAQETGEQKSRMELHVARGRIVGLTAELAAKKPCVDDRRENDEGIAIPGGDVGILASICAALDAIEAEPGAAQLSVSFEQIKEVLREASGGKLSCHCDDHNKAVHLGCGHIMLMCENPEAYGLTGRFGKAFVAYVKNELEQNGDAAKDEYSGPHAAQGVIIVKDTDLSRVQLAGKYEAIGAQAFIFHATAAEQLQKKAALAVLSVIGQSVSASSFIIRVQQQAEKQYGLTFWGNKAEIKGLATGLPQYVATPNGDKVEIEPLAASQN